MKTLFTDVHSEQPTNNKLLCLFKIKIEAVLLIPKLSTEAMSHCGRCRIQADRMHVL